MTSIRTGAKDILIVNGHVYPEVEPHHISKHRQPRLLYWNAGDGKFKDVSDKSGPGIRDAWSWRGDAAGDLDNDGSLEVVVSNLGGRPSLLKNFGPKKNWLLVRCVGVQCNRDAVGAPAYVTRAAAGSQAMYRQETVFLSQNDPRLHFGLGDAPGYDRIEVQWPGGGREVFDRGNANRIVTLKQGTGFRLSGFQTQGALN